MNEDFESAMEAIPEPVPEAMPEAAPAARPVERKHAEAREYFLAAALLLFSFLLWDSVIWSRHLGLGEAVGHFGVMAAVLVYLHASKHSATLYSWIGAILYLIGAVSLCLSGDNTLKLFSLPALYVLYMLVVIERLSLHTGEGMFARVGDFFMTVFPHSFGRIVRGWLSLFGRSKNETGHSRKVGAILIGLACAIPVLLILIPLLVSSDAAFAGLLSILDWNVFARGIFALSIGAFVALLAYSLLFCSEPAKRRPAESAFRGIEPFSVTAFLAIIGLAYVLYLISQFAYFFNGFRGLLPKDFTVAQYARRGFFEMCAIVFINLIVIVLAWKLCRRKEGELPRPVRILILFLCLVSLILVGAAISKMVLYMKSFGLTRLRIITSVFMIFLAVVIIAVGLRLYIRRLPAFSITVAAAALLLFALSVSNVDGIIARHNIRCYQNGSLDSIDMETISYLGNGAVPYIVELLDDTDPTVASDAREALQRRLKSLGLARNSESDAPVDNGLDIRSWNLADQQAREAILKNWDKLFSNKHFST